MTTKITRLSPYSRRHHSERQKQEVSATAKPVIRRRQNQSGNNRENERRIYPSRRCGPFDRRVEDVPINHACRRSYQGCDRRRNALDRRQPIDRREVLKRILRHHHYESLTDEKIFKKGAVIDTEV